MEELEKVEEVELSGGPDEVAPDGTTWVEVVSSDDVEEPIAERDVDEGCAP